MEKRTIQTNNNIMSKENIKSPLKQGTDSKYNRQTLSGFGGDMQSMLIQGAYMSTRANMPDYSWMNVVGAGVEAYKEEYDTKKALEKTKLDESVGKISGIIDKIYANGGSLQQEYFDQAYDYTQKLREEYIAAEESGDTKKALQIKGQLNAFATSIGTVKENITETAEMWQDDMLIDKKGMTPEQLSILNSIDGSSAVLNMEDGTFSWRNADYDPNVEGSKEFFTSEDLKSALPLKDQVGKESYLKANKTVIENAEAYRNGESTKGFDVKTNYDANMKIINDADNYMSWVWDDQTGYGSFADSLDQHPDFKNIFNTINQGGSNLAAIGLYDTNGDKTVDFRDFIDLSDPKLANYRDAVTAIAMKDGKSGISEEEMKEIMKDDKLFLAIEEITKGKLKDALTKSNHKNFDEDVTKSLVADFLTNRQRQMFYGEETVEVDGKQVPKYQTLVPDPGNDKAEVKLGRKRSSGRIKSSSKEGSLFINGVEITSPEQYVEAGGNWGYLQEQGYIYDKDKQVFKYVKPVEHAGPVYQGGGR